MLSVVIVWNERKRLANLLKHGLDFADMRRFDWTEAIVLPAKSGRFRAIGHLGTRSVAVIFSPLGSEAFSVISMRPANYRERRLHAEDQS